MTGKLTDGDHLEFKNIVLELAVGHGRAYAVLGKTMRFDAHLAEHVEDRGIYIAVALKLDDHQVARLGILGGLIVVKLHVEVYGQTFSLTIVDKRDALELVLYSRDYTVEGLACQPLNKRRTPGGNDIGLLLRRHRYTLFLGAPMIVLGLHFKECRVAVDIGAHTNLLARLLAIMVLNKESMLGRIPICSAVIGYTLTLNLLGEVFTLHQLQDFGKLMLIGYEFCVGAVHQFDATHLVKRDGR